MAALGRMLTWLGLLVASLMISACLDLSGETTPKGTQYFLFADSSLSVKPDQAARWIEAATAIVINRLRAGDAIVVYPVNDRTDEVAPLLDASIPPAGDGLEGEVRSRSILAAVRQRAREAVSQALQAPVRARQTRLLAALKRVTPDPARDTRVVFLTDARESSPALDLERTRLTDENLVPLAQAEGARAGWRPNMLGGVKVTFVLDSPGVNRERPVNDHTSLERFWRLVLDSLGAELLSFDSRISL